MNWGGAPSGTGAGVGRSGGFATAGGGGGGAGAGVGSEMGGVGASSAGGGAAPGGATGRGEAVAEARARPRERRWLPRPAWRSNRAARCRRGCRRGSRAPRAGLTVDSGRPTTGLGSWRSVPGWESPWLARRTLSSAPATQAKASSATTRAGRGLGMAQRHPGRRPRCAAASVGAAETARGVAKIEGPESAALPGAASAAAGTSKTLRRPPLELSGLRGIYIREARTPQTGPPRRPRATRQPRRTATAPSARAERSAAGLREAGDVRQRCLAARLGRSGCSRSQPSGGGWRRVGAGDCPPAT
jgi:hypothetical protein